MKNYRHRWEPDGSLVIKLMGKDPVSWIPRQQAFGIAVREAGFRLQPKCHIKNNQRPRHGYVENLGDGWHRVTPLSEDFALWLMMQLS